MSMKLHPVNEQVFQKAVQMLETRNKAAVFHPTGTGKSCIAWKVVEARPETVFFWLVAGEERLALRQAELTGYNGGTLPGNVRFCVCEKLAHATPEEWVKLGAQKPGCIILDCYQELSAVCWAQSVQKLLLLCPQAGVLGLSVPSDAPICKAAEELFADCIVSEITVAEAMAEGMLPVPSAYAALLWPQEEELAVLRARIRNLCMKRDSSLRTQYDDLVWSLKQVENPVDLLPRLMAGTGSRYLLLLESEEYGRKVGEEMEQLLRSINGSVRFYHADHACFADSTAVETFLADEAEGPKVLVCVNAPGVQQEIPGLTGAILVRQSSQMSVFKKMLCRALAAAGLRSIPVIDFVARFEGLGNGRALQRDCTEAMTRAGSTAPGFRQEKPMQQTYRLYNHLRRDMEARWDELYRAAADALAKEGTLELPRTYTIHCGMPVGKWLENQRQVQAGQKPGRLTPEQTAKLEKLGIRWNHRLEAAWEKGFAAAQKYRTDHGDLLVPVRYRDKNGFALGEWIVYNRQRYLGGYLSQSRIERLEAIGMVWNTSSDQWAQNYAAAAQYYLEHGDLEMPIKYETPSGFGLGVWLGAQRAAYKDGELTQSQIDQLNALEMDWTNRNDRKWMSLYEVAVAYYEQHGDLNVPSEYSTPDGVLLGKWVARQRYAYLNPDRSSARVTPERKELLDRLGMVWEKQDLWQERYELALAYKEEHGTIEIPATYKTEDGIWLGSWVARQRTALAGNAKTLTPERKKQLKALLKGEKRRPATAENTDRGTVRETKWERNFRSASRYARSHKHLLVPAGYVDKDGVNLGVWISNLRAARKNRPDSYQVSPAHIRKLDSIGMVWDARDAKWCAAYQQAAEYYAANGNLCVPANYKTAADGFCLGDWLRRMREWNREQDEKLTDERRNLLDAIGMEWN